MRSKITLQALTLAGILAVSGLPALAAEMSPATPAPGVAVQSDTKANVSGSGSSAAIGSNAKTDATVLPKDKKAAADVKTDAKASKDKAEQTAKVPAPSATVNGSTGLSVH
jgi:hypothetical protein